MLFSHMKPFLCSCCIYNKIETYFRGLLSKLCVTCPTLLIYLSKLIVLTPFFAHDAVCRQPGLFAPFTNTKLIYTAPFPKLCTGPPCHPWLARCRPGLRSKTAYSKIHFMTPILRIRRSFNSPIPIIFLWWHLITFWFSLFIYILSYLSLLTQLEAPSEQGSCLSCSPLSHQ